MPRFFRILPLGQVYGNTFIAVMQHSPFSLADIDFTLVTLWYAFQQKFLSKYVMSVTEEHYLLKGIGRRRLRP